jgi:hypothetical protein
VRRSQPPFELRATFCPDCPFALKIPHGFAAVHPLHDRSDILKRRRLRCYGGGDPGLVWPELFKFGCEQGGFNALSAAVEEQEMGDIVGLNL